MIHRNDNRGTSIKMCSHSMTTTVNTHTNRCKHNYSKLDIPPSMRTYTSYASFDATEVFVFPKNLGSFEFLKKRGKKNEEFYVKNVVD
jgi:hypothetical protein